MEYHKGLMKLSLADSLRHLMIRHLFEKITIKQICDETGVIRATFYNYFDDKYDCLNWIVYHDLVEEVRSNILNGQLRKALIDIFETVNENKQFYRVAYNVIGQNGFEDMVRDNLRQLLLVFVDRYRKKDYLMKYENNLLARYYAEILAFHIKDFVFEVGGAKTVEEVIQMIDDLARNSFIDFTTLNKI